jgi:energy-coupling factor transporter ATP-binding protein EcfA2
MSTALEVEDLHYRYPDGTVALRGVSFIIEPGRCLGLIGPNGAGKSTLLQHLNGLLPEDISAPQPVRVFGEAIRPDNLHEIRRDVGMLFQDANDQLFCPTVFEDVAFGPRQQGLSEGEVAERVAKSIRRVGLEGLEARPPHHLSGGEKRRAAIAGVLACEPRILILDEPTAELDPRGRLELKILLRELTLTRLIATHDLEMVVELCDSVLVLDGGQIVAAGTPQDVLANEPLMLSHGLETPHILRHSHPHPPQD